MKNTIFPEHPVLNLKLVVVVANTKRGCEPRVVANCNECLLIPRVVALTTRGKVFFLKLVYMCIDVDTRGKERYH